MNSSIGDREEAQVVEWLQSQAVRGTSPRLPSASQVWWRAQILRSLSEPDPVVERAIRPVMWSTALGLVLAFFALVMLIMQGSWPEPALSWLGLMSVAIGFPVAAGWVVARE